jgi:hypothetical protein
MQEAAFAHVDADMVDALAAAAEEHQITGGQRGAVGDQLPLVGHVARNARQLDAERRTEHITDQSAAVETIGRGATPAVGGTEQRQGTLQQGVHAPVLFGRRGVGLGGDELVDVAGEQQVAVGQQGGVGQCLAGGAHDGLVGGVRGQSRRGDGRQRGSQQEGATGETNEARKGTAGGGRSVGWCRHAVFTVVIVA